MTADEPGAAARRYLACSESLPIPGAVDWADAPGVFKLYRGQPRIALGHAGDPLGQLLADAYGLTRQRWTAVNALRRVIGTRGKATTATGSPALDASTLRPVASGGARFPGELYAVIGPGEAVAAGVYHYDPAHHALEVVRAGDFTPQLAAAMAGAAGVTILLTILFWKNAFKYGELSYRLCSLDGGALLGQLVTVAPRATVRYRFDDRALAALLQLDPAQESVYAAVALGDARAVAPAARPDAPAPIGRTNGKTASELAWSVAELPIVAEVHAAAQRVVPARPGALAALAIDAPILRTIALPPRRLDLRAGLHARRSSMGYFEARPVSVAQLAELLGAAASGYASDLDGDAAALRHTQLLCVVNHAIELPPGVYRYRPDDHALDQLRVGDLRGELQASLLSAMFNLFHAALCVYPVGDYEAGLAVHGDRWYRIQNLEAGVALQRLYLAAAGLGLRCHANLGYDAARTRALLGLPDRFACLIQLMVGAGRDPGDYYEQPCGY